MANKGTKVFGEETECVIIALSLGLVRVPLEKVMMLYLEAMDEA